MIQEYLNSIDKFIAVCNLPFFLKRSSFDYEK